MQVVFIGSGNLATHLSLAFKNAGISILQVYSHTLENARLLGEKLDSAYTDKIDEIFTTADCYIYALTDNALKPFLENLRCANGIHIHTAGSIDMDIFKGYVEQYGVIYPLQTFSKTKSLDFSEIPLCVEASSKELEVLLLELSQRLSTTCCLMNSEQRLHLHIAAVFASNFTNSMYAIASEILKNKGISFDLLHPLILETARKVSCMDPRNAQTGPAVRKDTVTMKKHEQALLSDAPLKKLYEDLSTSIMKRQHT